MAATDSLDLNHVNTFVRVVDAGSFTAAARTLGLPKSSVSRRVSALEGALRVRLLQRGTRKLVLTEAGRLYFERARAALGGLADASATVTDMSRDVAGLIRFTAGGDSTGMLAGLLGEFLARHPKVQLDVMLTPRRVDLVAEGVDLALRSGRLIDSSLVARRVGRFDLGLFASRAYLRRAGRPTRLAELARHRCILFGEAGERRQLRLTGPGGEETVAIDGPLVVHELSFAVDAIVAGIAIGLVPEIYLGWTGPRGRAVRGELVRVLPEYGLIGTEVALVSPTKSYEPARVKLLRDFLADRLTGMMRARGSRRPRAHRG
ncbi:MAG TPA: LysR family transcriptional regulator [Polyangia bacterium]|nr:LysR family transcriptional regulator [Polyangia bacterium]